MVRLKGKRNDWRSVLFFADFKVEEIHGTKCFESRTACNRKGELVHISDMSDPKWTGMAPSCHTYPLEEIDVEVVDI